MTQTVTHTDPDALLDQLTLEEQVALLSGADAWRTAAVPRLNIPPLKVSDGPAGVRGDGPLIGGRRTAAYPVGIALGATWNPALLREVGLSLAREAQDKGATVLVGGKRTLKIGDLMGTVVVPFMKLETEEDREKLVELGQKIIDFFAENALEHERTGEMIERIGIVNFLEALEIPIDPNMVCADWSGA